MLALYLFKLNAFYFCSSTSNEESSLDDISVHTNDSQTTTSKESSTSKYITFQSLFPSMKEVYGTELKEPSRADKLLYKKYYILLIPPIYILTLYLFSRYVLIGKKANGTVENSFTPISLNMRNECDFLDDTSLQVTPPTVSADSIAIYERYIQTGMNGGFTPKTEDLEIYAKYASLN